jgi:hypothetical protein
MPKGCGQRFLTQVLLLSGLDAGETSLGLKSREMA